MYTERIGCMALFLFVSLFLYSIRGLAQQPASWHSLRFKKTPFINVLETLEKKAGLLIVYDLNQLRNTHSVTLDVSRMKTEILLYLIFQGQPVTYRREGAATVYVYPRPARDILCLQLLNEQGEPLAGVSVKEQYSGLNLQTNDSGKVYISRAPFALSLECTHIAQLTTTITLTTDTTIVLSPRREELKTVVSTGYATQPESSYTGAVETIYVDSSALYRSNDLSDISWYPIYRFQVLQVTGLSWGGYKFDMGNNFSLGSELGGRDNNAPLVVIDKTPVLLGYQPMNRISSLLGDPGNNGAAYNLLAAIPAGMIERIDILQDAVATAPYGARGAHGVIVVTTRKQAIPGSRLSFSYGTGWVTALRRPHLLNGAGYRQLRRTALMNDGLAIDANTAPDVLLPDSSQDIDWANNILGNTGVNQSAQLSFSRQDSLWGYSLSATYQKKTYLLPAEASDQWKTVQSGVHYQSPNQRLHASGTFLFSHGLNEGPAFDVFQGIFLPPTFVDSVNTAGIPTWRQNGMLFRSPRGWMRNTNKTTAHYWLGNLVLDYRLHPGLHMTMNLGGTSQILRETGTFPLAGMAAMQGNTGHHEYAITRRINWIVEPQLNWDKKYGRLSLSTYTGLSFQEEKRRTVDKQDTNYLSDAELYAHEQRPSFTMGDSSSVTSPFHSVFGAVNVLWGTQWSANLVGRVDRSGRLSGERAWKPYYAAGLAWLFYQAHFLQHQHAWLSYGKLRMSMGTTGSDQMGSSAHGATPLRWAKTDKVEGAVELGLFHLIDLRASYYQYTSHNQFLDLAQLLPEGQTTVTVTNYQARVRNQGLELSAHYKQPLGQHGFFSVGTSWTFPRNRLLALPGEDSPFNTILLLNKPLSARRVYSSTGFSNKRFTFQNFDNNPEITYEGDARAVKDQAVRYYANMYGTVSWKRFQLGFNIESRKQGLLKAQWHQYYRVVPGNSVKTVLLNNQWDTPTERLTTQSLAQRLDMQQYLNSDDQYMNSVYWLMKYLRMEYCVPMQKLKRVSMNQLVVYVQGGNLFYFNQQNKELNPMQQHSYGLPPVRTITAGIKVDLAP